MKTLRTRTFLAGVVSIAFTLGQLAAQETAKQPFSIAISALSPSYKAGSSVELKVVITNTSDHEIDAGSVYDGSINATYEYDVRDIAGDRAPLKTVRGSYRATVMTRTLKPGESASDRTNVAKWVELSQPGEYVIQLSRRVNGHVEDDVVKSNIITITVVPPDPPANEPK